MCLNMFKNYFLYKYGKQILSLSLSLHNILFFPALYGLLRRDSIIPLILIIYYFIILSELFRVRALAYCSSSPPSAAHVHVVCSTSFHFPSFSKIFYVSSLLRSSSFPVQTSTPYSHVKIRSINTPFVLIISHTT